MDPVENEIPAWIVNQKKIKLFPKNIKKK